MRRPHPALPAALFLLLAGCALFPIHREAAQLPAKPYLLHFPGISGDTSFDRAFLGALKDGGFDAEMRLYDWTEHRWFFGALQNEPANRRQAAKVAEMIETQRRAEPGRAIYLTCESGGCGIAVWALEQLPDGVQVDGVILLSPAVSPEYDLTVALKHVRRSMFVYHSKLDWLVLGAGTAVFGTIDRRKTQAAGRVGFVQPANADRIEYAKLRQVPYNGGWFMEYGNAGGHIGAVMPRFASGELAPLLIEMARQATAAPAEPRPD